MARTSPPLSGALYNEEIIMKNKTAVITGATSGLGRATALQLAKKEFYVVIVARNDAKANKVIKEIENKGGNGQFIIWDLSSMEDTKEAAKKITDVTDRLDVLINKRLFDVTQKMFSEWL